MLRSALVLAVALVAAPALAGQTVNVPSFHAIDVHGGGTVTLRHGPVQKVTVIAGDLKIARIEVKGGTLDLSPCRDTCFGSHELKVEIVSPYIDGLHIHGGGDLKAEGPFPHQDKIDVSVHGGGDADIRAMQADTVDASVHGGGDLATRPLKHLKAQVHGGGDITYEGNPSLDVSTHGGGEIHHRK